MDNKKQTLTPELKQIYDRVMNTQVENKPASGQTSAQPTSPAPQAPVSAPQSTASSTEPVKPEMGNAPASATPQVPGAATMNSDKPFVFSGNKITTPQAGPSAVKVAGNSGKGISGVAIAGLVVVLLVVWGVFWAKLLGLF